MEPFLRTHRLCLALWAEAAHPLQWPHSALLSAQPSVSEMPLAGLSSALPILPLESTAHRLCIWVKGTRGFRLPFLCFSAAEWHSRPAQPRDCPSLIKPIMSLWETPALGHTVGDPSYTVESRAQVVVESSVSFPCLDWQPTVALF